jgi:hypothetical protein
MREADISVKLGKVPVEIEAPVATAEDYQVGATDILLTVPSVGRYWARKGRTLTIDPAHDADPGAVRLYLLGSGLAAILHQRGVIPLHAGAVERNGHCVAFLGNSGAGKSTLAALLAGRGYRLVSDDVLVARPAGDGTVIVEPSAPILKLWPDSFRLSGFAHSQAPFECADYRKHRVGAPEFFIETRLPVTRLYVLHWLQPLAAEPEFEELPRFTAMMAIRQNIYRQSLVEAMRRESAFMRFAGALLSCARVYEFRRAMCLDRADAQIDALEHHFKLT